MTPTPERRRGRLLRLLQSGDSAYPTGAYAHSFGLEGVVQAGVVRDAATLERFLREHALPLLLRAELPFAREAHRAAARGDVAEVCRLDGCCRALRGSRELREASRRVGAQRVQLAAAAASVPGIAVWTRALAEGRWEGQLPVAYGVVSALQGLDEEETVAGFLYQQIAGLLAASMKLLRIGQVAVQQILARALDQATADDVEVAADEAGWFAPLLDIAAARHETAYTRLFIS